MVLGSHGWSSEEHSSLTERIIESAPCAVLTVQEGRGERAFRLHTADGEEPPKILAPTDFSDSAAAAADQAFDLARAVPLQVHLLHVLAARPAMVSVDPTGAGTGVTREARGESRQRLREMVPEDLATVVDCHVAKGTVGDQILGAAERFDAELIVMGEHARGFFPRYFPRDTAREMLHRARCPVWYVPPPSRLRSPRIGSVALTLGAAGGYRDSTKPLAGTRARSSRSTACM